jgi:hypothetical protein
VIAPQILAIAGFLSITWGVYLGGTIVSYRGLLKHPNRRRQDVVVALRRFVVAFCIWLFCFSFVFRTALVLMGAGDEFVGQIVFFALLGTNVVGSLFACVSLWFD